MIVEEHMGDTAQQQDGGPGIASPFQQQQYTQDDTHLSVPKPDGLGQPLPGSRPQSGHGHDPFYSQYSTLPSPQGSNSRYPQQQHGYAAGGSQNHHGSSFNMGAMTGALPDYGSSTSPNFHPQNQNQRRPSGPATPAVVFQMQQNLQYPHQGAATFTNQPGLGGYTAPQYPPYSSNPGPQSGAYSQFQGQQRMSAMPQQYGQYPPVSPQMYYYPGASGGYGPVMSQLGHMQHPMGSRSASGVAGPSQTEGIGQESYLGLDDYHVRRQTSSSSLTTVPRGPPRKPKQSGHALWVGNLPPGATVAELKDHFSRELTKQIESLFLISKSNCAFVNYRTEAACQAAMQRFHDSRFKGVRLVCRLRRSSGATSGIPTGPSAMAARRASVASSSKSPVLDGTVDDTEDVVEARPEEEATPTMKVSEKFFIVKSLTLQDLEQSVRNGIWATQSHNEHILNKAFESADNVYLIFSVNKSGEYFGYARMTSPINENAAEIMRSLPQTVEPAEGAEVPKTIPTPATEWAPKGRIIDDSARGTIFWEADHSDVEDSNSDSENVVGAASSQVWGKPFKIEWLSTNRLPFFRTRGLRNSWNANREIKIARDGTELETIVGKRLIQLFHRPGPAPPTGQPPMMMPHMQGGVYQG